MVATLVITDCSITEAVQAITRWSREEDLSQAQNGEKIELGNSLMPTIHKSLRVPSFPDITLLYSQKHSLVLEHTPVFQMCIQPPSVEVNPAQYFLLANTACVPQKVMK